MIFNILDKGPSTYYVTSILAILDPPPPCHPFYYIGLYTSVTFWRTPPPPLVVTSFVDGPYGGVRPRNSFFLIDAHSLYIFHQ